MDSNILEVISSVLMFAFGIFGIICALIFILTVLVHRRLQTTTILLAMNSAVASLIGSSVFVSVAIYQLIGNTNDYLCVFRGHLLFTAGGLLYHTLCVQAVHRLFVTVLAAHRYLQLNSVIWIIVIVQWLVSNTFDFPIFLGGRIRYNPGSRLCLVAINDLYPFFYTGAWIYSLSIFCITLIYVLILRHTKIHAFPRPVRGRRVVHRRQQREIRLYFRLVVIINTLFTMGVPYVVFFLISVFNGLAPAPPYADQICMLSINIGFSASMLLNLLFTEDVRKTVVSTFCCGCMNAARRPVQRIATVDVLPMPTYYQTRK